MLCGSQDGIKWTQCPAGGAVPWFPWEVAVIMNEQADKHPALNLDALRFEELGRSPVTRSRELRADSKISIVPTPRNPRRGANAQRELHCTHFLDEQS